MKQIYFQMLDFEGRVPNNHSFIDAGYTSSLMDKAKEFVKDFLGYEPTEKVLEELGYPMVALRYNRGGLHISRNNWWGRKLSYIFYNQISPESNNIITRAHEEAHAASNLGLRRDLERMIGIPNLEQLCEEHFCNQAGLYALRKRDIEIPQSLVDLADSISGRKNLVPGKKYIRKHFLSHEEELCKGLEFEFVKDIDGQSCNIICQRSDGTFFTDSMPYGDLGIEPYRDSKGEITCFNGHNYVMPAEEWR